MSRRVLVNSFALFALFALVMVSGLESPRSQPRDVAVSGASIPFAQRQAQSMATRVVVLLEEGDRVHWHLGHFRVIVDEINFVAQTNKSCLFIGFRCNLSDFFGR